ncbi:PTS sugar transporter subunit IIB [Paratissierella segnis]|mgnify:CR=1 FL=1|jgi:PTS system cellobiose-specific IIB component|uniref:PTS sugar transporter subunit IIB n=1 Tax=Paratissierella segnis TaxID=2763679 RepID=A0A926EV21_9FIRM|nr:PTS sugar transporter subunit IIB [Paratissierella segnis]MBC8589040.1 PTS sugar transporter subunit IIB [Paratissierella segnis]
MKRIALFCSAGMSTSLLVTKMQEAAKKKGLDVSIEAFPEVKMEKLIDDLDLVLLGPQIRYAYKRAQKLCAEKGIPVDVISSVDYGMVDGEKVLEKAMKMMEK